jgi:hypothetical protein
MDNVFFALASILVVNSVLKKMFAHCVNLKYIIWKTNYVILALILIHNVFNALKKTNVQIVLAINITLEMMVCVDYARIQWKVAYDVTQNQIVWNVRAVNM